MSPVLKDGVEAKKSLNDQNYRTKRSPRSRKIKLQFTAHNKVFKIRMKSESSLFSPDIVFESSSRGRFDYDVSKVVTGHLDDEEDSTVEGVITANGLLDIVVKTQIEQYFIEPSSRYFPASSQPFHSVIYRLSDVHFPLGNITHKSPSFVHKDHLSARIHAIDATDVSPMTVHKHPHLKNHSSSDDLLFSNDSQSIISIAGTNGNSHLIVSVNQGPYYHPTSLPKKFFTGGTVIHCIIGTLNAMVIPNDMGFDLTNALIGPKIDQIAT
ncbi:uncharacterized protein CEXT_543811 [Caerostris extrusa]|uniref:Uncharacterized protein n=1 Tax=Caerostris extrusa TaxID=172846 RepID=A0AAV4XH48_CAEEX|nr:uncharacterized protein CEXT_543811 [Caerostris extrusa]